MKFCSRCGLALSGLAEWLAGGRVVPAKRPEDSEALSPRRKGIRRAAKLMFFSGVLFPIFLVISLAFDEGGPMVIPFIVFFIALVMMLYARLFSDNTVPITNQTSLPNQAAQTSALGSPARGSLPAAGDMPMPPIGRQVRTNELAQPPSVTENTTRLLDNE
ncbi:MAG TPA: hypothetical protein VGD38_18010 [Pyrinomonadaceae bacterium]